MNKRNCNNLNLKQIRRVKLEKIDIETQQFELRPAATSAIDIRQFLVSLTHLQTIIRKGFRCMVARKMWFGP